MARRKIHSFAVICSSPVNSTYITYIGQLIVISSLAATDECHLACLLLISSMASLPSNVCSITSSSGLAKYTRLILV